MADPDPVEAGLEKTRLELEAYAAELEGSIPAEGTPAEATPEPRRVDDPIGRAAAELLGGVLRTGLQALLERPRQPGRWKFTSRSHAAFAVPPPPPATTAPAPAVAPVDKAEPPKTTSRTPNTEVPGPGLAFVRFVNDRPQARESARLPTE